MKKKHIQKLNDLEEKINKFKDKLEKLESKKDKLKHRRIDEVFDDMEVSEMHLNDLKTSLEVIWRETREAISNRFHKDKADERVELENATKEEQAPMVPKTDEADSSKM